MRRINKIADLILSFIYPPKCICCGKIVSGTEPYICQNCFANLHFVPYSETKKDIKYCDTCYSSLYYEGIARDSIVNYKFNGKSSYYRSFAKMIYDILSNNGVCPDIITWAPISKKRKRKRGYDQSRLIAERLSEYMNVKCAQLLKKTRNNPAQSKTNSAAERRANVKGVYSATNINMLKGKNVLIIDDIVTTGATLTECCETLLKSGASSVQAATVAKTISER